MEKQRVTVMGLGLMGGGMAGRLLETGFEVTVYNRSRGKAEGFAKQGARVASTPREAASGSDVIIAMLADDVASREVWLGAEGALAEGGARKGSLLIDCSTVSPDWVRELAEKARERGCDFLDAPVTGSKGHAASGQLFFIVGGDGAAFERAKGVLGAMGRGMEHVGPVGSGALVKLINNFVCGVQVVALAEAMTLMERAGLDRGKALPILTEGAPGSPLVKTMSQRMIAGDFTPKFVLKLMCKDMRYALQEGKALHTPLDTATVALGVLSGAESHGLGDKDFSSVIEWVRRSGNHNAPEVVK